jgi:hypothetical protein
MILYFFIAALSCFIGEEFLWERCVFAYSDLIVRVCPKFPSTDTLFCFRESIWAHGARGNDFVRNREVAVRVGIYKKWFHVLSAPPGYSLQCRS